MELSRTAFVAAVAALAFTGGACRHRYPAPGGWAERLARHHRIDIVGAKALDRDLVASQVNVAGAGILPDVRPVEQLYESEGYLEAKVEVLRVDDGTGPAHFRIQITEGRLARVAQLTLEGLDEIPGAALWKVAFPLQVGSAYAWEPGNLTLEVLGAALQGAGYSAAGVFPAVRVDRETLDVRISLRVEPGPRGERYRFGPVLVMGTSSAAKDRIRRAVEPLVPRSEPFDVTRLETVRQRVLEAGAFERATVRPSFPSEARREIPILVWVWNAR